jgi:AAA15 family ATPase/GTPase
MLVRLFGKNFRSLKDVFELSLVAADLRREEDCNRGVIEVPVAGMAEPLRLLRAAAIYGPNASGKSTVLMAGRALHWLVTESSARSKPEATIAPYEPFLLDDQSRNAAIELGCDVIHDNSLLRYEVKFTARRIHSETLTIIGEEGEVKLIDRRPSGEVGGELIAQSEPNRLYATQMQPNVAVLSKLAQHGPHKGKDSVQPYYKAIRNATRHKIYSYLADAQGVGSEVERFADDPVYREWIMRHLIRTADVGICDVETRRQRFEVPEFLREGLAKIDSDFKLPEKAVVVSFVHKGNANHAIEFSDESSGTKKLFNIASDWWSLANEPVTLLADELSASLHPRLLDRLVRVLNEPPSSQVQSQLVFATHDTGLLESQDGRAPALRRDQVYFTKKNAKGATELYSLAEFKEEARPVHNIRKRYLSGLYGAIPSVEKLSL